MRALLVVLGVAAALGLTACGSGSTTETSGAGGSATTNGSAQTIAVSAKEFSFDPSAIQIDQPGTYTFTLANDGSVQHALEVEGPGVEEETDTVAPGSSGEVTITFSKAGSYEFYCPVDGHRGQGMEGTLTVGGAAAAGTGVTDTGESGGTDTGSSGGYGYGNG